MGIRANLNGAKRLGFGHQSAQNAGAGRIALRVEHPRARVRPLAREGQFASVLVEAHPPLDELVDGFGPFLDEDSNGFLAAQPVAGAQRVVEMQVDFIVFGERHGDAALRVLGA